LKKVTYKDSGVDIKKGERAVSDVKAMIKSTFTPNVLGSIGGFGGLFEVPKGYEKPVLVSSTDGVGTKLSVAVKARKHDTVGEDLVNHCINDIAVLGAKPLYFLDYFGTASLDEHVFNDVITGFVRGCKNNGVALVGGETAEMPGIYHDKDYDLCGTIVGIIEKDQIITGDKIQKGDKLVGIASNGLHTNGYSLARNVLFQEYDIDQHIDIIDKSLSEELLRVHKCYLPIIQDTLKNYEVHGISHITGGGIIGNTKRIVPEGCKISINWKSWDIQPIYKLIQQTGSVPNEDMRSAFNLGIGLIFIVPDKQANELLEHICEKNEKAWIIGEIK
jgi:phosphoribosylformylglycinamidine cyclo-ligase